MKSNNKYNGELDNPIKNLNYYSNLLIDKLNFFYVKYIYNFRDKHKLNEIIKKL